MIRKLCLYAVMILLLGIFVVGSKLVFCSEGYYQKAVYYGQDDIAKEIRDVIAKEFGKDQLKELAEYTEEFQKIVTKNAGEITEEELATIEKEFGDMLEDSDLQKSFMLDPSAITKKITQELGGEISEDGLKKVEDIAISLTEEEIEDFIKVIKEVKLGRGGETAENLITAVEIHGKPLAESIPALTDTDGFDILLERAAKGDTGTVSEARIAAILKGEGKNIKLGGEIPASPHGSGEIDISDADTFDIWEVKRGGGDNALLTKENTKRWNEVTSDWGSQIAKYKFHIASGPKPNAQVFWVFNTDDISKDVKAFFSERGVVVMKVVNGRLISA